MTRSEWLKRVGMILALAVVYFGVGEVAVLVATGLPGTEAAWPCLGIAISALLLYGFGVWPGVLIGAFFLGLTVPGNVGMAIGMAAGSTLEALAGWYLVSQFARGKEAFEKPRDIFRFALMAGAAATVGATCGAGTLAAGGFTEGMSFGATWGAWWLGDAAGAMLVAPLALLWAENSRLHWKERKTQELAGLFAGLLATAWIVFGGIFQAELKHYPLEWLCVPFVMWAAFRFGRRETATTSFALAAIAVVGTAQGFGPFAKESAGVSFSLLMTFAGIVGFGGLLMAAEVAEHAKAKENVENLAWSDALTGLANYRQVVEALETEIKRYGRTERPFVVLHLDVDGLKKINEAYGEEAGSRALCRIADMLRLYSREMDTAGRYGGDEFLLILPETDAEAGRMVAQRIARRLAEDGESPRVYVSIGMAIYPNDGETLNAILAAADEDLSREKGVPKKKTLLPS
ncbi:MAG TPA: MASE1 domain-containing protein [Candidatus Acidoferrum sp.]|nr:MASE1 domain-containing protein [Candidatus Acidoferrum sp.]